MSRIEELMFTHSGFILLILFILSITSARLPLAAVSLHKLLESV
jgi:hypothetical protein